MLTRNPFARHARPRRTPHATVTGALEILTSLAVIAAVALVLVTVSRPPAHTGDTGRMVARVATRAVAGFTPGLPPLTSDRSRQAHTGHVRTVRGAFRMGR